MDARRQVTVVAGRILGVMSMSLIIVMLNNVTLNVALPELSKDLKADNLQNYNGFWMLMLWFLAVFSL